MSGRRCSGVNVQGEGEGGPSQLLMATNWPSAAASWGWEDGNSVTLKEADGIDLPPSLQGGSREIYKRRASPVRVTSLPYKTSGAFPSELK